MKFGIDISYYQDGIDLSKAKSEGVKFAILRAGFTGYGDGISKYKDTSFETFYNTCKSLNIPVGAYWFSCANSYEKGVNEAKFMYENCLKNKQFEYPIYIDVEDTHYQANNKQGTTEAIIGFCETLEDLGYYVGVYANTNWFNNYIDTKRLTAYDKWVASWGTARPSIEGGMWQFGGEENHLRSNRVADRICDQNYSFKDYPEIMKANNLNGFRKHNKKSIDEMARECIEGKHGNYPERKTNLEALGYNYQEVQDRVNQILYG